MNSRDISPTHRSTTNLICYLVLPLMFRSFRDTVSVLNPSTSSGERSAPLLTEDISSPSPEFWGDYGAQFWEAPSLAYPISEVDIHEGSRAPTPTGGLQSLAKGTAKKSSSRIPGPSKPPATTSTSQVRDAIPVACNASLANDTALSLGSGNYVTAKDSASERSSVAKPVSTSSGSVTVKYLRKLPLRTRPLSTARSWPNSLLERLFPALGPPHPLLGLPDSPTRLSRPQSNVTYP